MGDILAKAQRSANMSRIRGTGNASTENRLIAIFKDCGITGWRRKRPLPGKPDFVFSQLRLTVFVDGCFWHACPLHATWPKNNAEFWRKKIERNRDRDREVTRELRRKGWRGMRIWEHELKLKNRRRLLSRFRRFELLPGADEQGGKVGKSDAVKG